MLPRSQRLSVEQFATVMKEGRANHSSLFLVRALVTADHTRISVTISSKIAKTAVLRNRIRRKLYEAIKPLYSGVKEHIHVVVIAKAPILTMSQSDIETEIKSVFVKAGLLR